MKVNRYSSLESFRADVLELLLADEVRNNLPIGVITDTTAKPADTWFMSAVTDNSGNIVLVGLCTKPFNMMLCPVGEGTAHISDDCLQLLSSKLHEDTFEPPGVLAQSALAERFTEIYHGSGCSARRMIIMRLDELKPYKNAPGFCRTLRDDDIPRTAQWEHAFSVDCRTLSMPPEENVKRISTRLGRDIHFIWEDGVPVSQAVFGRETPNGAIINWVYTPPEFRSRGYASSVVSELSKTLLKRGKRFCGLFADADNPISRGIYSKLGYYDVCNYSEITFL